MKPSNLFIYLLVIIPALMIDVYLPIVEKIHFSLQNEFFLSFFLIPFGIMQFFSGFIIDKFGERKIILYSSIIFIIATLPLVSAQNLDVSCIYIIRVIQGLCSALLQICAFSLIKSYFANIHQMVVKTGVFVSVAPIFAPVLGLVCYRVLGVSSLPILISFLLLYIFKEAYLSLPSNKIGVLNEGENFFSLVCDKIFLKDLLISMFSGLYLFSFISFSKDIVTEELSSDKFVFTLIFAFNALSMILADFSIKKIKVVSLDSSMFFWGIILVLFGILFFLPFAKGFVIFPLIFITTFFYSKITFSSRSLALKKSKLLPGLTSSLVNSLRFIIGGFFVAVIPSFIEDRLFILGGSALFLGLFTIGMKIGLTAPALKQEKYGT